VAVRAKAPAEVVLIRASTPELWMPAKSKAATPPALIKTLLLGETEADNANCSVPVLMTLPPL